jgi:DNA polymerase
MTGSTLNIRLPNGRELKYYDASVVDGAYGPEVAAVDQRSGGVKAVSLPTLIENIDQAASRDLLADALIRCREEQLPVVLHVYDEIVIEVDEDDDESGARLKQIMCDPPKWAGGLPVHAKLDSHRRYTK